MRPGCGTGCPVNPSDPLKGQQAGVIEGSLIEAAALQAEAGGFGGAHDAGFAQSVGAGGLAGAWEELADALEERQQRRVRSEAHDQMALRQRRQVSHHLFRWLLRVVDEHIQADHGVVAAAEALQIGGQKADPLTRHTRLAGPAFGLLHHRLR